MASGSSKSVSIGTDNKNNGADSSFILGNNVTIESSVDNAIVLGGNKYVIAGQSLNLSSPYNSAILTIGTQNYQNAQIPSICFNGGLSTAPAASSDILLYKNAAVGTNDLVLTRSNTNARSGFRTRNIKVSNIFPENATDSDFTGTVTINSPRLVAPVIINGTEDSGSFSNARYFNQSTANLAQGTSFDYVVNATGSIVATGFVARNSSRELKDIEEKASFEECSELLNNLSLYKYRYKDLNEFPGTHYGVMSEDVRELMPWLVGDNEQYLPNIMAQGIFCLQSEKSVIYIDGDRNLDGVRAGDKIKFFVDGGKTAEQSVILSIEKNLDQTAIYIDGGEGTAHDANVFVYGTWGNAPAIQKERLFELNLVITQGLLGKIEELSKKIEELNEKI